MNEQFPADFNSIFPGHHHFHATMQGPKNHWIFVMQGWPGWRRAAEEALAGAPARALMLGGCWSYAELWLSEIRKTEAKELLGEFFQMIGHFMTCPLVPY